MPEKIHQILNGALPGVIRSKGHFWLATRPNVVAEFSLAGALSSTAPIGTWWASFPEREWPQLEHVRGYISRIWEEPWGDRRQEIVFIGSGIDWPALKAKLDDCLLPESSAQNVNDLPDLPDPFPAWRPAEAAE